MDVQLQRLIEENEQLKQQLTVINKRNKAFETAVSVIADGFLIVERDGSILEMNQAYCDYFGVDRKTVLGKPIQTVIRNTKMLKIMDEELVEIDAIHEFLDGQTATGERKVAVSRMPIYEGKTVIGAVAFIKFSRYTQKLVRSLHELGEELEYYRKELTRHSISQFSFDRMASVSESFCSAKAQAERFAKSDFPILLRGETGVGKEVFAKAIHLASDRRDGPFICVNCTSIPAELFESELFGYEEGAFSGSRRGGKRGKFELANHGTLLLDEIGDMPVSMQVKLLRVLQGNVIEKLGSERPIPIDARIIAATNQDIETLIEKKAFREDLYYRLNVLPVTIPPLRARKEDIMGLTYVLLNELNQRYSQHYDIAPETISHLQAYAWPGNVRELSNVIGRAFMMTDGTTILPGSLPLHILLSESKGDEAPIAAVLEEQEKEMIRALLKKNKYNCSKAAKEMGIHRATLYAKLAKFGLSIQELRASDPSSD